MLVGEDHLQYFGWDLREHKSSLPCLSRIERMNVLNKFFIWFRSGLSDYADIYFTVSNAMYCGTSICSLSLLTGLVQLLWPVTLSTRQKKYPLVSGQKKS